MSITKQLQCGKGKHCLKQSQALVESKIKKLYQLNHILNQMVQKLRAIEDLPLTNLTQCGSIFTVTFFPHIIYKRKEKNICMKN